MGGVRSFLAIRGPVPLPPELAAVVAALPRDVLRPLPAAALHITLCFLGDRPAAQIADVAAMLGHSLADSAAFDAALVGLGAFPHPRRPGVLWAGMGSGRQACLALADGLRAALAAAGLTGVPALDQPHLSLARRRGPVPEAVVPVVALLAAHGDRVWGQWPVREVVLFRSELRSSGAVYTPLAVAPLAARGLELIP